MSIDTHLDQVFKEGAESLSKLVTGKICRYRLDGMGYTVNPKDTGKTGTCRILGVYYSPNLDCNVYALFDLETEQELHPCEFEVRLEDM